MGGGSVYRHPSDGPNENRRQFVAAAQCAMHAAALVACAAAV